MMKSHSPLSMNLSISSLTSPEMNGSMASMRLLVNETSTRLRYMSCSGGSRDRIWSRGQPSFSKMPGTSGLLHSVSCDQSLSWSENVSQSFATLRHRS